MLLPREVPQPHADRAVDLRPVWPAAAEAVVRARHRAAGGAADLADEAGHSNANTVTSLKTFVRVTRWVLLTLASVAVSPVTHGPRVAASSVPTL